MQMPIFDIENPTDVSCCGSPPADGEIGLRFCRMREQITNKGSVPAQSRAGFTIKWEQMIAQMSMNMCRLLTESDSSVLTAPGCRWDTKSNKWIVSTNQCVDVEIVYARVEIDDKEWYTYFTTVLGSERKVDSDKNIILDPAKSLVYAGIPEHQQNSLVFRGTVLFNDGLPKCHVFISNKGSLRENLVKTYDKYQVVIVKIGVPGHYTMALVHIHDGRIEFFDPSGTYDKIGWEDDNPNKPYSETLRQRRKLKGQEKFTVCVTEDETTITDFVICNSLSVLFPGYNIVGINPGINLQIDDRDAYCNTWIWLYTYVKFVHPQWSTQVILEYFKNLTKSANIKKKYAPESLKLIEKFWDYIICLPYK